MDCNTGKLVLFGEEDINQGKAYSANYIEVKRELTHKEKMDRQIRLYNPCACGSGKKFKFCHYIKP